MEPRGEIASQHVFKLFFSKIDILAHIGDFDICSAKVWNVLQSNPPRDVSKVSKALPVSKGEAGGCVIEKVKRTCLDLNHDSWMLVLLDKTDLKERYQQHYDTWKFLMTKSFCTKFKRYKRHRFVFNNSNEKCDANLMPHYTVTHGGMWVPRYTLILSTQIQ